MQELIAAAAAARENAYCPYSGYQVGAALRDETGRIHVGCNVENISYGGTICAERGAVMAMAAAGGKQVVELAVVTKDGGTPCGICRQILSEFSKGDCAIHLVDAQGSIRTTTLGVLFPEAFNSAAVQRTESTT